MLKNALAQGAGKKPSEKLTLGDIRRIIKMDLSGQQLPESNEKLSDLKILAKEMSPQEFELLADNLKILD